MYGLLVPTNPMIAEFHPLLADGGLLIMDKHILKHRYLFLLTVSTFIFSACGVNEEKVTTDINSNIQSESMEVALEIYNATLEKLSDNSALLSEFTKQN